MTTSYDTLRERYPTILGNCSMWFPDGWFALVKTLAGRLTYDVKHNQAPAISIHDMKVKYDSLSVSTFQGGDDRAMGAIIMTEWLAEQLCQYCGAPSRRVGPDGYPIICCQEFVRREAGHEVPWADEETRYYMLPKHWPTIFPHEPEHVGFGWIHLLEASGKALSQWAKNNDKPYAVVTHVKEKFGALSIFHEGGDPVAEGMIRLVEDFSARTCQVCGRPGRINTSGWRAVRCDEHREVRL